MQKIPGSFFHLFQKVFSHFLQIDRLCKYSEKWAILQKIRLKKKYYDIIKPVMHMLKKHIIVYIWFFLFILLFLPYRALNSLVLLNIFGNDSTAFNANDVTVIISILIALLSVLLFVYNFIKEFGLKTKKKVLIFFVSLLVLSVMTFFLREAILKGNLWDYMDVV